MCLKRIPNINATASHFGVWKTTPKKKKRQFVIQAGQKSKLVWLVSVKTYPLCRNPAQVCRPCVYVMSCCHVHLPSSRFCALDHAAPSPKVCICACRARLVSQGSLRLELWRQKTLMVQFTVSIKEASLEKQDVCVSLVQIKSLFRKVLTGNKETSFWNGMVFEITFCVWTNSSIITFK